MQVKDDYYIYSITNPKGSVYIGQTCDIERRFKEYKRKSCKKQRKLYNSLNKYGVENHTFSIICTIYGEPISNVLKIEQRHIDINRKYGKNLMNLAGAEGNGRTSEETKKRLSVARKGVKVPPERVRKGFMMPQETKDKISKSLKGRIKTALATPIVQYANNFPVKEWLSIREASRSLSLPLSSIINVCKGIQINVRGYVFKYKNPS